MTVPDSLLRVAALTQGANVPSSRFRVSQHVQALRLQKILVDQLPARHGAYPPVGLGLRLRWLPTSATNALVRVLASRKADVCWLQRELVSTLCTAEPLIRAPLVFDVDDAIYLHPRGRASDRIAKQARLVICGNRTLAEHYAELAAIEIVPTAVDTDRFRPQPPVAGPPRIGWSGSSSGFLYLQDILPAIQSVMSLHTDCRFVVMADRKPDLRGLPVERVDFMPWSEAEEVSMIQSLTVGLMPLHDSAWARGKCSFKMLCYMACGIPVVVSPVGMNSEVLELAELGFGARNTDEWVQAMDTLLADPAMARRFGEAGRGVVEKQFAASVVVRRLAALLRQSAA
jgi:glycosyltransferase involved in cell wall biosynthesis